MPFPIQRLRRLRRTPVLRRMLWEVELTPRRWVLPLFVQPGDRRRDPIPSMPGQFRWSIDRLPEIVDAALELGICSVILFGIPRTKDPQGSEAYDPKGIVQRAVQTLKERYADQLVVITDVCLCEYTSHGHCGVVRNGEILNDATLDLLARTALSLAEAGADIVAPSAMMDGQVQAIRKVLDDHGFAHVPILAYAAKFASAFYGPFREAADSAPAFGDRRAYQMPMNRREALLEMARDLEEGADILMVKPALAYLDVLREARDRWSVPLAAYNVSGEYAMVKAAAQQGWLDEARIVFEILTAIHRAGADWIITYHALDAARWLRAGRFESMM